MGEGVMTSGTAAPWQLGGPADARKAEVFGAPTRATILDAAAQAVLKDRAATHGAVEDSFAQIGAIWSVRLGVPVTPEQVAILLIDLKTVRAWGNPGHADNWVDIAGYAACGGELALNEREATF